jgi:hypothetical protein
MEKRGVEKGGVAADDRHGDTGQEGQNGRRGKMAGGAK